MPPCSRSSRHDGDTFRAVYTVRFGEVVYVLHVFQKKSKRGIATPKKELELIRKRLKLAEEDHKEWSAARRTTAATTRSLSTPGGSSTRVRSAGPAKRNAKVPAPSSRAARTMLVDPVMRPSPARPLEACPCH